ncbi:Uma2 family endonuclease [Ancylothrix sp. C2]|uniref:Uma2 family endonuclease n=1 Tax=Ancylothrix sp. D3o TaxID=2953691 RepID=UPI0021BAF0BD|nr:Uma2 family endonuclease [Ancylothrix sp. D3o]MCT7952194.1 Uma2 family endonuclease [Ancylothrix sp. D3o]
MTATLIEKPAQGVVLKNISWQTYESLLQDLAEQPGVRLTYDRGTLEIMTPLAPHEKYSELLGNFVEVVTDELNQEICSLGSLTCKREDLARGLEPDKCFYIKNEDLVWNKEQIDFNQDPPPDLAIEIDITSSSIDRLTLYASLGVPEVWRYDGTRLIIYQLEENGYVEADVSRTFPFLPQTEIMRFLDLRKTTKEKALLRLFRRWVKSQIE